MDDSNPRDFIQELQAAKGNVRWLLDNESGLVDMHGLVYWAEVVRQLRADIRKQL